MEPKPCIGCQERPRAVSQSGKRRSYCKPCDLERCKKWQANNRDKLRTTKRKHDIKKRYGLSWDEYQSMLSSQEGLCAAGCGKSAAVVDHCHKTGRIRGVLCNPCNLALGLINDSPQRLVTYLTYKG